MPIWCLFASHSILRLWMVENYVSVLLKMIEVSFIFNCTPSKPCFQRSLCRSGSELFHSHLFLLFWFLFSCFPFLKGVWNWLFLQIILIWVANVNCYWHCIWLFHEQGIPYVERAVINKDKDGKFNLHVEGLVIRILAV